MMESLENIDKNFRKQLEDYQEKPRPGVWDNIADRLGHKKKRKLVFFISRVAAGLVILFSLSLAVNYFSNKKSEPASNGNSSEGQEHATIKNNISSAPENDKETFSNKSTQSKNNNKWVVNQPGDDEDNLLQASDKRKALTPIIRENPQSLANNKGNETNSKQLNDNNKDITGPSLANAFPVTNHYSPKRKREAGVLEPIKRKNPEEFETGKNPPIPVNSEILPGASDDLILAYIVENNAKEEDTNKKSKKWEIGGQFGPSYSYRDVSTDHINDYIKDQFDSHESGVLAYVGGINVNIRPGKRLSVQSGVYYSKYGIDNDNLQPSIDNLRGNVNQKEVFSNWNSVAQVRDNTIYLGNSTGKILPLKSNPASNLLTYDNSNGSGNASDLAVNSIQVSDIPSSVTQYFEYVEIPLNLKYKIVDKKMDFAVISGVTTNFLIRRDLYGNYNDGSRIDGTTDEISKINFAGLIGFSIEYPILADLIINLEPKFKYYLNPIYEEPRYSINPYSFGIYTGVSLIF